jgi:hypothetical protein
MSLPVNLLYAFFPDDIGFSVCPIAVGNEYACLTNTTWKETWGLSLGVAIKTATADTYMFRNNATAFQLENLSQNNPDHEFAISDMLAVFSQIFLPILQPSSNLTDPNYTTNQMMLYGYKSGTGAAVSPDEILASWLVTPFLLYQPNGNMNGFVKNATTQERVGLPPDLYTTMDFAQTIERGVLSPWTVFVFLVLACFIYFSCLACLLWSMTIQGPPTTHFQLVEFAARIVSKGASTTSWATVLSKTSNGDLSYLRSKLVDKNVYLGDVSMVGGVGSSIMAGDHDDNAPLMMEKTGTIGFSLTGDVAPLVAGKVYT